jgi:membrane protease YdiL (CAAX protease family)
MSHLNPENEQVFFIFAITATLLGFYGYFFLSHSAILKKYFSGRFSGDLLRMNGVLFHKLAGCLFMGILPAAFYLILFRAAPPHFGITLTHLLANLEWMGGISVVIVLVSSQLARSPKLMQQYPEMRINRWTARRFAVSSLGWIAYLTAYEVLFRGFLLFASLEAFGYWPAIAVNVAIYSAVHLPKGIGETLGAIPFGILACVLTINTGSILIPLFAHISLAVSMEYFTIKYNPEMSFVKISNPKQIK